MFLRSLIHNYRNEVITRGDLEELIFSLNDSSLSVQRSLLRSAELVNTFKQLAHDQYSQQKRTFKMKEYLYDLLISYRSNITSNNHQVKINCPEDLFLTSYPSAYYQIFSNLLSNSLEHAFDHKTEGSIVIDVSLDNGDLKIIYRDDGVGIPKESVDLIFDPFFHLKD